MLFGIGNWAKIIESDCLPGKTNAQMNLQLQRLLGQQSTAGTYKEMAVVENILHCRFNGGVALVLSLP
jgi:hypothetical protein